MQGEIQHRRVPTCRNTKKHRSTPVLETKPLPEIPAWEAQDIPEGFGDVAAGGSDVEVAALTLADMQHATAKSLIEAKQLRTAMLEVAQALIGDWEPYFT
jgi:hypothetical protein